jgi:hypothetical protein
MVIGETVVRYDHVVKPMIVKWAIYLKGFK